MFIFVAYKDSPELSNVRRRSSDTDLAEEKTLLVNPNCYVRVMLEYIRKQCKLGKFTRFDLCDDSGYLKGLFNLSTYVYAGDQFEHKKTYYVIVLRQETEKRLSALPQLNRGNKFYPELNARVKRFMALREGSSSGTSAPSTVPGKVTSSAAKLSQKKK